MTKLNVWALGDCDHEDFAPALEYLRRETKLIELPDVGQALSQPFSANTEPAFLLIAASRPGRFSAAEIEAVHRRAPLAGLAALLGSWCEGEVRSGRPWPGVARIYAHSWQAQLLRALRFRHPRTATEADRLLQGTGFPLRSEPGGLSRPIVGIASRGRSAFEALTAACCGLGQEGVWLLPGRPLPVQRVDALIYEATLDLPAELEEFRALRDRLRDPPALLLLDFPRAGDLRQASLAGADAVLSRPLLVADLAAELARISIPVSAKQRAAA